MGINKVIYYGEVLVDMSQVTVTPEKLGKGETALDAKGDLITGTHECAKTEPKLQSKTVTPTTNVQTVNPDSGYDGLSKVTVNAMPTATQATPSITVSSTGLITASATQTAGYVASGTESATKQLTTQAAKTITPSTSSQTAVASGRYTTGAVTVAAIPSTYVKPSATKAATTYTPSTSNQTIAAGTYCSGVQTIKGDANLVAGNIKKGTSIFGVTGSYEGSGGGSGGGVSGSCSVTIDLGSTRIIALRYIDGDGVYKWPNNLEQTTVTATIACNSIFSVVTSNGALNSMTIFELVGCEGVLHSFIGGMLTFRTPNTPMNCTIRVIADDGPPEL